MIIGSERGRLNLSSVSLTKYKNPVNRRSISFSSFLLSLGSQWLRLSFSVPLVSILRAQTWPKSDLCVKGGIGQPLALLLKTNPLVTEVIGSFDDGIPT